MKKILTIAGSDPSGGAGIQADLKTITVHKMYGMSVITALTAQNTTGVFGISEVSPEFVSLQLGLCLPGYPPGRGQDRYAARCGHRPCRRGRSAEI